MGMTRQGVTQHLAVLEAANLVVTVRRGREKFHYLNPVPINEIYERWIGKYERGRLQALSQLKKGVTTGVMDKPAFVYVTYIAAPPETVWKALTDGEFTRQYWGGRRIQSDWAVGSPVSHIRDDGGADWQGEVLQSDYPRILSYTFHMQISDEHRAEGHSRVTFELESMGPFTRLTLLHDQLEPGSKTFETTRYGWPAIVSSMKSFIETGSPLPFARLGFGPSGIQKQLDEVSDSQEARQESNR